MSKTTIEWTEQSWNPITGCTKISAGCKHCYAETFYERFYGKGSFKNIICHEDRLDIPLKTKKPTVFFVNSMSDLFHEQVPFEFIHKIYTVMALCPQHTFQVLTKRSQRMVDYYNKYNNGIGDDRELERHAIDFVHLMYDKEGKFLPHLKVAGWFFDVTKDEDGLTDSTLIFEHEGPLENVWVGVSVENQEAAEERIPHLIEVPSFVRWLSCEPLLGPINLLIPAPSKFELHYYIDWIVVGGESGPGARRMDPGWVKDMRYRYKERCGIPFFFKQWGAFNEDGKRVGKKKSGRLLDGVLYNEYPKQMKVKTIEEM